MLLVIVSAVMRFMLMAIVRRRVCMIVWFHGQAAVF
jgi:hypothetical protein